MANLRFFAEVDGQTVRFDRIDNRSQSSRHTDTWGWHADSQRWIKIERVIEYRSNPSRHECDASCMNATGRTMQCECKCGGKNHGKGAFRCEAAA